MGNKLTQKEINKIIENHKHWLNEDVDGWDNMKANFSNQDLSYVYLSGANLHGADLGGADLSYANLSGADISGTNLSYANIRHANLSGANISCADISCANISRTNLRGTNLSYASLCGANLIYANLSNADLSDADINYANLSYANLNYANLSDVDFRGTDLRNAKLCNANLCFANLSGANLHGAELGSADFRSANLNNADLSGTKNMMYIPMACPEEGSFIGFKKAVCAGKDYIVKLEISADALRSSATRRKCRCNKAKVLEIQNIDGSKANIDVVHSICDPSFQYKTGQIVEEPKFDNNRFNECSKGIHFFINRQEAVNY